MKYTKESIVKSICGIESSITIEELFNSMSNDFKPYEGLETILKELNDGHEFLDEFYFNGDEFCANVLDTGVIELLENCFGEKYLMMDCERFFYDNLNEDGKGGIWRSPNESIDLVESDIYSDEGLVFSTITKGHYEDKIDDINEKNLLTDKEKIQTETCDNDDENYQRTYNGEINKYIIKKAEFNPDKWWLGWKNQD